jgi:lipoprotein-anchoring transpeptidase ErfK/SrfK
MIGAARRLRFGPLTFAAVFASAVASASFGPPWVGEGELPLSERARSVHIVRRDEPLLEAPRRDARRVGSAAAEVLLPLFGAHQGAGCKARWLAVGPTAWVCEDAVELSPEPPLDATARLLGRADGLLFRYFFVGRDGSFGYRRLDAADVGAPDAQLEPGFAVAITQESERAGERYGHTNQGLWIPMRDLGAASPSAFRGRDVAGALDFAWVVAELAKVRAGPQRFLPGRGGRARFEVVPVLEEVKGAYRVGEGEWIDAADARRPTPAAPPPEIDAAAGERWIDVELATQTLVAYEGVRPVFATLVSTGRGRQGTASATPLGTHRVWMKLVTSNMDNLEEEEAQRYYRMEDVPWVQYFAKGVGLHGAFWHRSFGQVRSHGCVNLAPLDAQRLFRWTSPHLPAGWTAAAPTPYERGTVVRVR